MDEAGNEAVTQDTTLDAQADADAFNSGFGSNSPTETPGQSSQDREQDSDPAGETEQQSADQPEPKAPEYAQITVEELALLRSGAALSNELKATLEKVQGTAFGKIGGIERQLKELSSGKRFAVDPEKLQQYRDDGFPELADALEHFSSAASPGAASQPDHEQLAQAVTPLVERKVEARLLSRDHPDWEAVSQDPAFTAFVKYLPQERQAALVKASDDWNSAHISREMTAYKDSLKPKVQPAQAQEPDYASTRRNLMQAAVTPRGTSAAPGETPDDSFNAGFRAG